MSWNWKDFLPLQEGYEIISIADAYQEFRTGDRRMDNYSLLDYFNWSETQDGVSIVYKVDGLVAGAMYLTVHYEFIVVEMLGKNILVVATRVGTKLMSLVENIARQLKKKEIRLESLDTVVQFYDGPLGYSEFDSPYYDNEFGRLTPKRKLMLV